MHKFRVLDTQLLFDENSNSLFEINELISDILDAPSIQESVVLQHLAGKYEEIEIREALAELLELRTQGRIFAPAIPEPVMPVGEPQVKALCLHTAHDCNLRCTYCFAGTGPFGGSRELMSSEVGRAALEMLVKTSGTRRNLEVDFFGGEPLLNWELVKELVSYGRELEQTSGKRFRFTLTTNATLLTDEVQDFLNENEMAVVLSLDGREDINDKARPYVGGAGSYASIVPAMQEFVAGRNNKNYYVRGTYTRFNLDFAADVRHMVELGFREVSVEPVVGAPADPYTLRHEDLPQLEEEYERLAAYYVQKWQDGKPFNFFHFNVSLDHGPCVIKQVTGCGAGYDYLAVAPDGKLYPCHQFVGQEEFCLGDVHTAIERIDISQEFQQVNLYQKEGCGACWARFYCSGGCHAHAYYSNGDFRKPDALACALQKKRLECALYVQAKTKLAL